MVKRGIVAFLMYGMFSLLFAASITVNISGIVHNDGFLRIVLFNRAEGFPSNYINGIRDTSIVNPSNSETVTFANLPAGTYAVSILHDRNGNKRIDSGMFGIPKEPWGVSNNVHPRMRAPRFDECDFSVQSSQSKTMSIKIFAPK